MRPIICLCVVSALLSVSGCSKASTSNAAAEEAAVNAAQSWLSLVDNGRYSESWEQAAGLFKNAITKKNWGRALNAARGPLGALQSRTLKSKQFATTLPGAPDGQYVVIQFTASFKNRVSAIETITPMLDNDGSWRVSGYFIK